MTADPTFTAGQRLPAGQLNELSPDATLWTPSWTNVTLGTSPTNEGWYSQIGRKVDFGLVLVLGTGGSVTGTMEVSLPPVTPAASLVTQFVATVYAADGTTRYIGGATYSTTTLSRFFSNGTAIGWNATLPFTWAAGDTIRVQGGYLAA